MSRIILFSLLVLASGHAMAQAITGFTLTNPSTNNLLVGATFNQAGSGPVILENSSVNLIVPKGYINPIVTSSQGGTWSAQDAVDLALICGAAGNNYNLIVVTSNSQANLGAVSAGVSENLFNIAFSGSSTLQVRGFDPVGGDAISACLRPLGVNNTASIDVDGNAGSAVTVGYEDIPFVPSAVFLPVELVSFQAKAVEASIHLSWESKSEQNFSGYELQRSANGVDFVKLAWIPGKGGGQYSHPDEAVRPGITYYYRLRMLNLDGKFELSPVRSAKVEGATKAGLLITPNPATHHFIVDFETSAEGGVSLELLNPAGQIALQQYFQMNKGKNKIMISTDAQPSGTYMVKLKTVAGTLSGKLVIEH